MKGQKGPMAKLTREDIEAGKSKAGGYTREQTAKWGVPWPLTKGWKKKLIGQEPTQTTLDFTKPIEKKYIKPAWVPKERYIPDEPNPLRSYRHEATRIARHMREQLDKANQ